ncbi:MAG TPA: NUDIX domain-containing protein [Thermomicrobiales bacterium]|jgi:8-oxo-dGTP pyrophosphatase MutT (NUDIX family)|nr:NUDIX domain-containing protein [Thermomicrobiales bacterium]
MLETTWDGLPVSPTPPVGATILAYRRLDKGPVELLILHRRAVPTDGGDWAWGPPSGARFPGEDIAVTAARELNEETGITGQPTLVTGAPAEWYTYAIEAPADQVIVLSDEHDRHEWVDPAEAVRRVAPETVSAQLRLALAAIRLA